MRTLVGLVIVATLLIPGGAARADGPGPHDVDQVDSKELPPGVKAKGKLVEQAWTWMDGDRVNQGLALFSSTNIEKGGQLVGRDIYVQLYRGKPGKLEQIRLVRDWVHDCEFDVIARFVNHSVSITDADADNISELTFAYDLACTSDVSPETRKLIVLEGKDKHALRGTAQVDPGDGSGPAGGEYKADPFRKAPALKALAEARWKELLGK